MSKSLVTIIGLVVSLGVLALGFFLVALPMLVQANATDSQTAGVASTNAIYQAQVDALNAEAENLDEITASVASLRSQIPATGQFDDVFEVIGRAAESAGVALTSVTAGEIVEFEVRGTEAAGAEVAAEPDPSATPLPTDDSTSADATADQAMEESASTPNGSRMQASFQIQATSMDPAQVTAFLDALRSGPRLLQSIETSTSRDGSGLVSIQISALTYVDAEG